jgi:hypothetical protein
MENKKNYFLISLNFLVKRLVGEHIKSEIIILEIDI